MWIYGTISDSIIDTILKKNATARDLWLSIESLFRDNKEARALQLENELRTMVIGDLSVHDYCQKMKTTADLLANIDAPISERALVSHLLNGLSDKFDSSINVVQHKVPFPTLLEARSMLQMEETRLSKQVKPTPSHHDNSSSSTVLYAGSDGNSRNTNNNNYHNSGRGNRRRHRGHGRSRGRGRYNNNWPPNQFSAPWYYNHQPPVYAPMPPQFVYPQPAGYQPFSPGPAQPFQQQRGSMPHQGILGHPSRQNHEAHMEQLTTTPQLTQIPAGLTHAFNTMTLQEPGNNWYMDSGASTHITSNAGTLQSLFNKHTITLVTVGNGSIAAVQNSGNGTLVFPSRSFALHNVLVCPNIIKNLISVRKFVTDNSCAIEFDPFGFSVKDLRTRTKLLRCNNIEQLYLVTPSPPLPSHSAFTITSLNGSVWHARLGHPSNSTLSRILSFFLLLLLN